MPDVCGYCEKEINLQNVKEVIYCTGGCENYFHAKCTNLKNVENVRKLGARKDQWKCSSCKESSNLEMMQTQEVDLKKLTQQISEIHSKLPYIEKTNETVRDLETSVKFISTKFDDFQQEITEMKKTVRELSSKSEMLKSENFNLKQTVDRLETKLGEMEQQQLQENIEAIGIPETREESTDEIVGEVAKAIGIELKKEDIKKIDRISTGKDKPRKIVAQLSSKTVRDNWLHKFRAKKVLLASVIKPTFPNSHVYLNEQLTMNNRKLLYETKQFAKTNGIRFVWIRDGRILTKENETARVKQIKCLEDLQNIKK